MCVVAGFINFEIYDGSVKKMYSSVSPPSQITVDPNKSFECHVMKITVCGGFVNFEIYDDSVFWMYS